MRLKTAYNILKIALIVKTLIWSDMNYYSHTFKLYNVGGSVIMDVSLQLSIYL